MKLRGLGLVFVVVLAACGGGGDDEAARTSTTVASTTASTADATTTTVSPTTPPAAETTTTAEPEGPTTPPEVLAADGIATVEDAAVFVVTSWVAGDRSAASRHAESSAVESLFASPAPAADALELIECDTADLERYDCFFTADGTIIIVGVERLRVVEATVDSD